MKTSSNTERINLNWKQIKEREERGEKKRKQKLKQQRKIQPHSGTRRKSATVNKQDQQSLLRKYNNINEQKWKRDRDREKEQRKNRPKEKQN